jgi:hypothetical protein
MLQLSHSLRAQEFSFPGGHQVLPAPYLGLRRVSGLAGQHPRPPGGERAHPGLRGGGPGARAGDRDHRNHRDHGDLGVRDAGRPGSPGGGGLERGPSSLPPPSLPASSPISPCGLPPYPSAAPARSWRLYGGPRTPEPRGLLLVVLYRKRFAEKIRGSGARFNFRPVGEFGNIFHQFMVSARVGQRRLSPKIYGRERSGDQSSGTARSYGKRSSGKWSSGSDLGSGTRSYVTYRSSNSGRGYGSERAIFRPRRRNGRIFRKFRQD